MSDNVRIDNELATAEKIDVDWENNTIRARYQNGDERVFTDVKIHMPSLIRELHRQGIISRTIARQCLRDFAEKL